MLTAQQISQTIGCSLEIAQATLDNAGSRTDDQVIGLARLKASNAQLKSQKAARVPEGIQPTDATTDRILQAANSADCAACGETGILSRNGYCKKCQNSSARRRKFLAL